MPVISEQQLEARIVDALVEFGVERDELRPDATLEELDIDSLDLFELTQILEADLGIKVNPDDFDGIKTFGDAQRLMLSYVR